MASITSAAVSASAGGISSTRMATVVPFLLVKGESMRITTGAPRWHRIDRDRRRSRRCSAGSSLILPGIVEHADAERALVLGVEVGHQRQ